jgi:hypothetical protein
MSVPPGDRQKSSMQFIETARRIEFRTLQVCRRWPKSWFFLITQRTVALASELYEHAQRANSYFPILTEQEQMERIMELDRALATLYPFAQKIELAYSLFPLCGEKDKTSERERADKSSALLEEFMNLCLEEEEALKGNIVWTRNAKVGGSKQADSQETPKEKKQKK